MRCRFFDVALETKHAYPVQFVVDRILQLADQARRACRGQSALEDGKLQALPVFFADTRDLLEPVRASPAIGVRDIVGN